MLVLLYLSCWSLIGVFGADTDEIQSVSVMEGDSVSLNSYIPEISNDDITWTFGAEQSLIAKIKRKKDIFSTYDVPDGRFRDRLKLDNQNGSLIITNTTTQHTGVYQLRIFAARLLTKTFNVTVYARLPVPVIHRDWSSSSSSCSVLCSVVNVGHVTLSWYKGNSVLSSISVSDLSISLSLSLEVEYQENDTYSCVLNNPLTNQTTHLDISRLCHTCPGALIALISVVVVGSLLIIAAVGIFCFYRKCRKTDREVQTCEEEITYAETSFHKRNANKSNCKEESHVVYASVTTRQPQIQQNSAEYV